MSHSSHREGVEPYATLCPGNHPAYCQCDLIARVRENERDNCWGAVAEIPAVELWDGTKAAWWIVKADALAAIEALGEER